MKPLKSTESDHFSLHLNDKRFKFDDINRDQSDVWPGCCRNYQSNLFGSLLEKGLFLCLDASKIDCK